MKSKLYFLSMCLFTCQILVAQVVLEADGEVDTYELINSVFAPGYNVIEAPDCSHEDFGRHIDQVYDGQLNKEVFRFRMHTSPDDDRCINFDRQRNEIKTYDKSPDNLLGIKKEIVEYKWKFKISADFQPSTSFTHLHQLKAVGGTESSMPLITLTARKATPERLELRYAEALSQTTIHQEELAPMKGVWLEATERVLYEESGLGQYDLEIKRVDNSEILFSYNNDAIRMWKTEAEFIRPKWGIYRSLNDAGSLKDEDVFFADFSIHELTTSVSKEQEQDILLFPNPANDLISIHLSSHHNFEKLKIYNRSGSLILSTALNAISNSNSNSISHLPEGIYFIKLESAKGQFKLKRLIVNRTK